MITDKNLEMITRAVTQAILDAEQKKLFHKRHVTKRNQNLNLEKVDFSAETHTLQLLTIFDKAQKIAEFKDAAIKFRDSTKKPIAKHALDRIVFHLLVKGKLPLKQASQIEQEFFPKANRAALVYGRKIAEQNN